MKKFVMLASVAALGLGLAACDSTQENAAEEQAEQVREASDAAADAMESGVTSDATEDKADAIREAGDEKADAMEDQADKADPIAPE